MSRAFVKEDIDLPERSGRARSASGLPPGAANYMSARGANRLREKARVSAAAERKNLEQLLASATIVDAPDDRDQIAFGAKVTVRNSSGECRSYQIVGVDELELYDDVLAWISADGKALLAAEVGDRLTLTSGERIEIVGVEYPES